MAGTVPLEQRFLPEFDFSDSVACTVAADAAASWAALLDVDLIAVGRRRPLVAALGAARVLPEIATRLLSGRGLPPSPEALSLRAMAAGEPAADGDWVTLGEREGSELALGLVGRFWKPVIEYARVEPGEFTAFAAPGWAKTVYCLAAEPLDGERTQLRATMRTATTDARARRWFRRYWTFGVGSGAQVLVGALLEAARVAAEARYPPAASRP